MKFFVCTVVALIVCLSQKSLAAPLDDVVQAAENEAEDLDEDNARFKKSAPQQPPQGPSVKSAYGASAPAPAPASAYGGPALAPISYSYQAPAPTMPCARNLLFSCQPSVAPVPCAAPHYSAPAPSYSAPAPASYSSGPVGAYSEHVPQWAAVPTVREVMYGY